MREELHERSSVPAVSPTELDTPGATRGVLRTTFELVRSPVWRPVWFKVAGIGAGMLGLAAIGMFSTVRQLDASYDPSQLREANTWLAGGLSPTAPAALASSMHVNEHQQLRHAAPARLPLPAETGLGSTSKESASPSRDSGSASLGSASLGSASLGSASLGSASLGSASLGSASLGSASLGSASLGSASHDADGQQDAPAASPEGVASDGKVILNTANVEELQRLPGVGRKRAERILELRDRLGRFKRTTDLLRVRGIGVKSLRKMLPHLMLDPPAPPRDAPATGDANAPPPSE